LTGRFDENKYFIDKSLKDKSSEMDLLRAQITALETQVKEIQAKLSSKTDTDAAPKDKPDVKDVKKEKKTDTEETKAPETKTPKIKDPAKAYEAAYASFKNKKYKEAREKFDAFQKEFPKDKLVGNAQFWIAEAYYAEEDYAGAIVEYDALLKNYPKSEKAPAALLKQGYSFIEMGDKKAARGILEQLKEKYPKSKEAVLAKKKLEEMNKKGKK
jgi:tol-pal system protein YbgF